MDRTVKAEIHPAKEELVINSRTELIVDGNRYEICADNADAMLDFIKHSINPGTPVVQEILACGHRTFSQPRLVANFFISDGTIDNSKRFGIKNGKDGATYAKLYGSGEFRIIKGGFGMKIDEPMSLPSVNYDTLRNEGTFSNSGGWNETTKHVSGTQRLLIGEYASLVGREVIGGIEFVQDSMCVRAPHFYSTETHSIVTPNNIRSTLPQSEELYAESRKRDMVSFVLKMLSCAGQELDEKFHASATPEQRSHRGYFADRCSARQVSTYSDGENGIEMDDYYLAPEDFIIAESSGARRYLGFLKHSDTMRGDGYFLPAEGMKRLAKLAFSDKHIGRYYPKA